MSMFDDLNWDQVLHEQEEAGTGFTALPADKYPVLIENVEAVMSKTDKPMLKFSLKVTEGPYKGRTLFNYLVFDRGNAQSMGFTIRKLGNLGLSRERLQTENPKLPQMAEMFKGMLAVAEVTVGTYNDEPSNDVKTLKRADGATPGTAAPMAPAPKSGVPSLPTAAAPKPAGVPSVPTPAPAAPAAPAPEPAPAPVAEAPAPEAPTEPEPGVPEITDEEPF